MLSSMARPTPSRTPQAPSPEMVDRVAARLAAVKVAKARYAALRKVHRALAADFAAFDEMKTAKLIKRALRNVDVWETGGVASPYYVRAWRRILQDPATGIPKMLRGHNANALVQNSPFGFIYREPKYRQALHHGDDQGS